MIIVILFLLSMIPVLIFRRNKFGYDLYEYRYSRKHGNKKRYSVSDLPKYIKHYRPTDENVRDKWYIYVLTLIILLSLIGMLL